MSPGSERDKRSTHCRRDARATTATRQRATVDLGITEMTYPDKHPPDATPSSITVRAAAGQLRIVPVWQALGQHAAQAKRTRLRHNEKHNFDEMTVTFESVSPEDLAAIASRLSTLSSVMVASLHPAQASLPNVCGEADPGA
ncbi:hypothetical protein SAMN05446635_5363 [Burkholderia sp. OK233]|nr:hypothetical protein SAMN05446635_0021 [Burkholderia sp. OK233]SOE74587.1 hypothetical protein SAMN05446635_5363 [Burkholderia sp. OK233]